MGALLRATAWKSSTPRPTNSPRSRRQVLELKAAAASRPKPAGPSARVARVDIACQPADAARAMMRRSQERRLGPRHRSRPAHVGRPMASRTPPTHPKSASTQAIPRPPQPRPASSANACARDGHAGRSRSPEPQPDPAATKCRRSSMPSARSGPGKRHPGQRPPSAGDTPSSRVRPRPITTGTPKTLPAADFPRDQALFVTPGRRTRRRRLLE